MSRSGYVLPTNTSCDTTDRVIAHFEDSGNPVSRQTRSVESPDLDDVGLFELGARLAFSTRHVLRMLPVVVIIPAPHKLRVSPGVVSIAVRRKLWILSKGVVFARQHAPLGSSVANIVGWSSKPQMGGVTAGGKITAVTHMQRAGIFPRGEKVEDTSHTNAALLDSDSSIAVGLGTCPRPAGVRTTTLVNPFPTSGNNFGGEIGQRSTIGLSHKASTKGFIGQDRGALQHATRSVPFSQEGV